jgi:hypothetical protein
MEMKVVSDTLRVSEVLFRKEFKGYLLQVVEFFLSWKSGMTFKDYYGDIVDTTINYNADVILVIEFCDYIPIFIQST